MQPMTRPRRRRRPTRRWSPERDRTRVARVRLEGARREAAARWSGVAAHVARPFADRRPQLAGEFYSQAMLALVEAAAHPKFDPEHPDARGFLANAARSACYGVLELARPLGFRHVRDDCPEVSQVPVLRDDDGAATELDPPSREPDPGHHVDVRDLAEALLGALTPLQRRAVEAVFWGGLSASEFARRRGAVSSSGTEVLRHAILRMRRRAAAMGLDVPAA